MSRKGFKFFQFLSPLSDLNFQIQKKLKVENGEKGELSGDIGQKSRKQQLLAINGANSQKNFNLW